MYFLCFYDFFILTLCGISLLCLRWGVRTFLPVSLSLTLSLVLSHFDFFTDSLRLVRVINFIERLVYLLTYFLTYFV